MHRFRTCSGWVIAAVIVLFVAGCATSSSKKSSDSSTPSADPLASSFVPTAADSYEPDNTAAQAGVLELDGALQRRTLFGPNDDDWVRVALTAGVTYELFTTNLNETGDTYLYLIDTDGVSYINSDDDYLDYDSHIEYTPTVSGTYHLMVRAYDPPTGIATYSLGARTLADVDGDFWSAFYDCNDSDNTIYPDATETPDDGIDQDCNGIDQPSGMVADAAEPDDTLATARDMVEMGGSYEEIIYRRDIYEGNGRTLHTVGDVDYFRIVVPAWGYLELYLVRSNISLNVIVYDAGGNVVGTGGGYYDLPNPTASPVTFYITYEALDRISTGWYVPAYVNLGTDQDQDTYYTGDWSGGRDCNDNNASIYDFALETDTDGVDSNCDGADGTATVTYPESYPPAGLMQPAGALGSHHPAKARR